MTLLQRSRLGAFLSRPAGFVSAMFLSGILLGTPLLMLPVARRGPGGASFLDALFTSTSAICVTGLSTVDVPVFWSGFGQAVILVLVQVGGFGIMALAASLFLALSSRLGLRRRLLAQQESGVAGLGDLGELLRVLLRFTLFFEVLFSALLTLRFFFGYDEPFLRALWLGVFHAVSAFNNAGFALFPGSLSGFVTDPWVSLTVAAAVVVGSLGFPVLLELRRRALTPRSWSLHTRLTLYGTGLLLSLGMAGFLVGEWSNPATFGPLDVRGKLLAAFFHSAMPRSAGFNSLDFGSMGDGSLLLTDLLMFVGGGAVSTAGGVKVTTLAILFAALWAELRGDADASAFSRSIPVFAVRQALAVTMLGLALVLSGTFLLLGLTSERLSVVLFEVTSAFSTAGLSTGVTGSLPPSAQLVLVFLMFLGRVGPLTFGAALVLREHQRTFRFPEERPLVG